MHTDLDFIGDIHGDATALRRLLSKLGYENVNGAYRHAEGRRPVFTGDYVDTGTENLDAVEIVQAIVEQNAGVALMGNHDFNIVALNRPIAGKPGRYLRSRSTQHMTQCATTQAEIEADPERGARALTFLAGLPLWLEIPGARVVHAYWDIDAMEILRPHLSATNTLSERAFIAASAQSGTVGDARAQLLSGPEVSCEPYLDRYGQTRTKDRLRWWDQNAASEEAPIFFGHYALQTPLSPFHNAVCVDGGIAKGREMVAYRHTIGNRLSAGNFVYA